MYIAGLTSPRDFLKQHKLFKKHILHFAMLGGTIHVFEGPVLNSEMTDAFCRYLLSVYTSHGASSQTRSKQFGPYTHETCKHYFQNCTIAVHIYAEINGILVGCQTYMQHFNRLELSEGGFLRDQNNH